MGIAYPSSPFAGAVRESDKPFRRDLDFEMPIGSHQDHLAAVPPKRIIWGRMPKQDDPFTGTWKFNAQRSTLSTQTPQSWVQRIAASPDEVNVRENIVRSDGLETVVSLRAKFDGTDYPVHGSPAANTIAYRRIDRNSIAGTGKKNGVVTLTEMVTVAPENHTLIVVYSIHDGPHVIANGIALFEKGA